MKKGKRKVGQQKVICDPSFGSSYAKRQRGEDSNQPRQEFVQQLSEDSLEASQFSPAILQKIFANIPARNLLSSCSLVSKTWNAEVRKFVRDKRICAAKNNKETTACEFMKELDLLCGQMKQSGRVVPFNYLKMDFSKRCEMKSGGDEILYNNVITELELKGLNVAGSDFCDCEHHRPLSTVLKYKSRELRSLKVDSTAPFSRFGTTGDGWFPQLAKLEELRLEQLSCSSQDISRFQWLLRDASKLKRIFSRGLYCLKRVPTDVLARVAIHGKLEAIGELDAEEVDLLCAIADRASGLKELIFKEVGPNPFDFGEDGHKYFDDEPLEGKPKAENRRRKCKTGLEQLLGAAQKSLETIKTNGIYHVSQLSHPPLINLSKLGLILRTWYDWNDMASLNFPRNMPNLKEVGLKIEIEVDCKEILYSSWTVSELNLELKHDRFNLGILGGMFPKVSVLNLLLKDYWPNLRHRRQEWSRAPIRQVCANWPQLEEFKMTGPAACMNRNYDAEFCGLFYDEVEQLRGKDDEYLKKVQIVPSRPGLLSLPKLREFWFVEDAFALPYDDVGHRDVEGFMFGLAQFLVFSRLPHMNVCLPPVMEHKWTWRTIPDGYYYY